VAKRPHTKFAYLLQYTGNVILVFRLMADNRGVNFLLDNAFDELGVFWNRVLAPVVPSDLVESCYSFWLATIQKKPFGRLRHHPQDDKVWSSADYCDEKV